jgi:LacI family transcriptional regulator
MAVKRAPSRVTLSAVAADAGVTMSTASTILSENPAYLPKFSPATIRRVRKSADKLGYQANLFASGLSARGASRFFALVLRDTRYSPASEKYLWSFDADLLGGIIEVAVQRGLYPVVAMNRPEAGESEMRSLGSVINGGVFGAIVRTPTPALERLLRQKVRAGWPTTLVFPQSISAWSSNAVDTDNVELGIHAGRMLAKQRRRRWLVIRDAKDSEPQNSRILGFRTVARESGAKVNVVLCPEAMSPRRAAMAVTAGLDRYRPDGAFAMSAQNSLAFLRACRKTGREPGKETLHLGCDCSVIAEVIHPRITSLEVSWRDVGAAAMEKLMEMRDTGRPRFPNLLLKHKVFPGDTCPVD